MHFKGILRLQASLVAPALLSVLLFTACSGPAKMAVDDPPAPAPSEDSGLTQAELEDLYWARTESARTRFVDADVEFMTGMISHHAQALIMSGFAPTNGANAEIQVLAARIINAQKDEIALMQKWLRDRGQPAPEVHGSGMSQMVHGAGDHSMHMAGMLSMEQLKELEAARGAEFDRLFLTYMIQHHSGAITMVEKLFATDGAGQDEASFRIASDINVDQETEIARMQLMLTILAEASQDR